MRDLHAGGSAGEGARCRAPPWLPVCVQEQVPSNDAQSAGGDHVERGRARCPRRSRPLRAVARRPAGCPPAGSGRRGRAGVGERRRHGRAGAPGVAGRHRHGDRPGVAVGARAGHGVRRRRAGDRLGVLAEGVLGLQRVVEDRRAVRGGGTPRDARWSRRWWSRCRSPCRSSLGGASGRSAVVIPGVAIERGRSGAVAERGHREPVEARWHRDGRLPDAGADGRERLPCAGLLHGEPVDRREPVEEPGHLHLAGLQLRRGHAGGRRQRAAGRGGRWAWSGSATPGAVAGAAGRAVAGEARSGPPVGTGRRVAGLVGRAAGRVGERRIGSCDGSSCRGGTGTGVPDADGRRERRAREEPASSFATSSTVPGATFGAAGGVAARPPAGRRRAGRSSRPSRPGPPPRRASAPGTLISSMPSSSTSEGSPPSGSSMSSPAREPSASSRTTLESPGTGHVDRPLEGLGPVGSLAADRARRRPRARSRRRRSRPSRSGVRRRAPATPVRSRVRRARRRAAARPRRPRRPGRCRPGRRCPGRGRTG